MDTCLLKTSSSSGPKSGLFNPGVLPSWYLPSDWNMATIPFDEIVLGATARLAVIQDLQYLSIRDIIMHCAAVSSKPANKIWERLPESRKQEVATECRLL